MGSLHVKLDKKRVQPIFPSIALSLVLARLAKPPFANGFITFSKNPQFVTLDPAKSLDDTVSTMQEADWGMNTDFNAVFLRLILPLAVKHQIKQEDMIKRVFVFTDMQFDAGTRTSANSAQWATNHDEVKAAYHAAGYEVPQIVYWDLSSHGTTPVTAETEGVALMNGFSPAMLKVFMGEEDEEGWETVEKTKEPFNPVAIMRKAVERKSFDGLVVVD
ncbi:hypothetical protein HGRIS_001745 [Hohenbuehelia grisea]|uniref:DUF7788 domain-containing protein n=1 Tax=Hohenbuehelia grisea TaxID=104357 RepID=A0ABR3JJ10_9AGAR